MFTNRLFFLVYFLIFFLQVSTKLTPESIAYIHTHVTRDGDWYLMFEGEIDHGSAERVHERLLEHRYTGLIINSPGGYLSEGTRISKDVWEQKLSVSVPRKAMCASACFLILAASNNRVVAKTARIGVHSALQLEPSRPPGVPSGNDQQVAIMKIYDVPSAIIDHAITTPAKNMYWLTRKDLLSMDVRIVDTKATRKKKQ